MKKIILILFILLCGCEKREAHKPTIEKAVIVERFRHDFDNFWTSGFALVTAIRLKDSGKIHVSNRNSIYYSGKVGDTIEVVKYDSPNYLVNESYKYKLIINGKAID